MKKAILLFTIYSFLASHSFGQDSMKVSNLLSNNRVLVEYGTSFLVQSLGNIKSNKVSEGDKLEFQVFEDLLLNKQVVIKAGTLVEAFVSSVEKSKAFGKEGNVSIQFIRTKATDNSYIPIRANNSSIKGDEKLVSSIALSVLVTPFFLLKKGGQAKINEGGLLRVYVIKDVFVTVN